MSSHAHSLSSANTDAVSEDLQWDAWVRESTAVTNLRERLQHASKARNLAMSDNEQSKLIVPHAELVLAACWVKPDSNEVVDIATASAADLERYSAKLEKLAHDLQQSEDALIAASDEGKSGTNVIEQSIHSHMQKAKQSYGNLIRLKGEFSHGALTSYIHNRAAVDHANSHLTSLDTVLKSTHANNGFIADRSSAFNGTVISNKHKKMRRRQTEVNDPSAWNVAEAKYNQSYNSATIALREMAEKVSQPTRTAVTRLSDVMHNVKSPALIESLESEEMANMASAEVRGNCEADNKPTAALRLKDYSRLSTRRPASRTSIYSTLNTLDINLTPQHRQMAQKLEAHLLEPTFVDRLLSPMDRYTYRLDLSERENEAITVLKNLGNFAVMAQGSLSHWCQNNLSPEQITLLEESSFANDRDSLTAICFPSGKPTLTDKHQAELDSKYTEKSAVLQRYRDGYMDVSNKLESQARATTSMLQAEAASLSEMPTSQAECTEEIERDLAQGVKLATEILQLQGQFDADVIAAHRAELKLGDQISTQSQSQQEIAGMPNESRTRIAEVFKHLQNRRNDLSETGLQIDNVASLLSYIDDYHALRSSESADGAVDDGFSPSRLDTPASETDLQSIPSTPGSRSKKLLMLSATSSTSDNQKPSSNAPTRTWAEVVRDSLSSTQQ